MSDYALVLQQAHLIRSLAVQFDEAHDLDAALGQIQRADSVGSILDPTAYRDKHEVMRQDEKTIRAVRDLARLHREGGRHA